MPVRVVQMRENVPSINVCSNSPDGRSLSPFILGPVKLYGGLSSTCVENGWQFAKVYETHTVKLKGKGICITPKYWKWAKAGWKNNTAVRHPFGRTKPLCSLWKGKRLLYIEARKNIYIPLYARAAFQTDYYHDLKTQYKRKGELCLKDYDGYDYLKMKMTLYDVLHNPNRIMGHAHVLAMMLDDYVVIKGDKVKIFDEIIA